MNVRAFRGLPAICLLAAAVGGGAGCTLSADECRFNSDCDDDEACDDGECVDDDENDDDDDDEDDDNGAGEGEGEGGGNPDPQPHPDGPRFLQFSTNVTTVHDDDTVIFTAVLTDPDGIDDIIGGSLVDPTSSASYGAFQTSAAEGSYEVAVSWDAMNAVAAIDFGETGSRAFQGRFFDVAGHVSVRTLLLTLSCDGDPACDGVCGGARCGDGSCTFSQGSADEAGNGICGATCRSLSTATSCGGCNASCGANDCVLVENNSFGSDTIEGVCTCEAGDCASGEVCMGGILSGGSATICNTAEPRLDASGRALLDTFDATFPLCGVADAEAALLCANNGQSGGSAVAQSNNAQGFVVDCAGVTDIRQCVFTASESCAPALVTCDRDFSCAAADAVLGDQAGTLTSFSPGCPLAATASTDVWSFTAPHDQLFFFETPDLSTIVSVSRDCTAPEALDCGNSQEGVAVALSAGETVIVAVAAHAVGPFGSVGYVLRIR